MSEKCKTCTNLYPFKTGDHLHGNCKVLPGLIGVRSFDYFSVPGDFGCSGHTPKPKDPEIVVVRATYEAPGGGRFTRNCSVMSQEDWEKVIAAVENQHRQGRAYR